MPATISLNPFLTTVSNNSFQLQTDGFVQGVHLDDPAKRYALEGGIVAQTQTTPLWGGLPLSLNLQAPGPGGASSNLGPSATLATATTNIDAWCLINQAAAGVITASSNAPLYPSGASLNFARIGCGLLVCLPINPSAVNTLAAGSAHPTLYWDYVNNRVDITGTTALTGPSGSPVQAYALNTNSKVITYVAATGFANWTSGGSIIIVRI